MSRLVEPGFALLAVAIAASGCELAFTAEASCPGAPQCRPDTGASAPDAAGGPLDAATTWADASLDVPDSSLAPPDAAVVLPDGSVDLPDARVVAPDASGVPLDASLDPSDASVDPPDASVDPADASSSPPDGGTCSDLQRNGPETDVDCGGPCGPCADCKRCQAAADCAAGVCTTGTCGAAGSIRIRASYWTINDVWLRHVNLVLDCQNALNRQCNLASGCSAALAGDCGGTCDSGEQCWLATTYGAPQGSQILDLTAALGCPHTVCLYPGSYPGFEWGGTLESFSSGWSLLASSTDLTGWNWLCAPGVQAK